MVTSIVRDEIIYTSDLDEWDKTDANPAEQLHKYNTSRKRFLFYPWGVFCTAYARRNLWLGIFEFGKDYCYSDTDSIKCVNMQSHMPFINDYNQLCENKLRAMCSYHKLNYEDMLLPKTQEGELKPLGVYDHDGQYIYFKTIGAKRYMDYYYNKKTGKNELSITVSGVNKKVAVPYLVDKYGIEGCFNAFNEELAIPEDYTGKLTHNYIDDVHEGELTDYLGNKFYYHAPSGIYFEKASYDFTMDKYLQFLKGVEMIK